MNSLRVKRTALKTFLAISVITIISVATAAYLRPIPAVGPTAREVEVSKTDAINLPWPVYGQAALGANGYGLLSTSGEQKPVPIASLAKVVAALSVLEKKPLSIGQKGPIITLASSDVQLFEDYFARGGSVVKVQAGEKITEYEALQAMLLPSGNNIADSLALWAFGSDKVYLALANQMVSKMGLADTRIADASGFSPQTVSTAKDLARIGQAAMANPVIAEIVNQKKAVVPVAGEISNVNWLLGQEGVIGVKTGNTEEAGGCFLFAADRLVGGKTVRLIGAVLGAPTRNAAIADSRALIQSADAGFKNIVLVSRGELVGRYQAPWGAGTTIVAKQDITALVWKGSEAKSEVKLQLAKQGSASGTDAGIILITVGEQQILGKAVLKEPLPGPSWIWRIFHR